MSAEYGLHSTLREDCIGSIHSLPETVNDTAEDDKKCGAASSLLMFIGEL